MRLAKARKAYQDLSCTLSNVNRQLALSGLAIVWFFVHPQTNEYFNLGDFRYSFELFCAALFLDLLYYSYATLAWGTYSRRKEKKGENDFKAPAWINRPTVSLLFAKVSCTVLGYGFLLSETHILV